LFIIFDLDDTLVDTSTYTTPAKLREVWEALARLGEVSGDEAEFRSLLALHATSASSRETWRRFCSMHRIGESCVQKGIEMIYGPLSPAIPVKPVPGALQILPELVQEHVLAVVSVGEEGQQKSKLEKAGIDSSLFYKILCVEEGRKKPAYETLIQEKDVNVQEVIVCGDRVLTDLVPAKELGCTTLHMRRGRGANNQTVYLPYIDFILTELAGLESVLATIRNRRQQ